MFFILIDKLHIKDFIININDNYNQLSYYYNILDVGFGLHNYKIINCNYKIINCNYEIFKKIINYNRYDVINIL